eukprot:360488-Chlamydomonas_euryale.AAC.18
MSCLSFCFGGKPEGEAKAAAVAAAAAAADAGTSSAAAAAAPKTGGEGSSVAFKAADSETEAVQAKQACGAGAPNPDDAAATPQASSDPGALREGARWDSGKEWTGRAGHDKEGAQPAHTCASHEC